MKNYHNNKVAFTPSFNAPYFNANDYERAEPKGQFNLFSIAIKNCTHQQALKSVLQCAKEHTKSNFAFVNADCLNKVWTNFKYRKVLQGMQAVYADGIGVKLAAKMSGVEVVDNVNGTDLFPQLCEQAAEQGLKVFLLGSRDGIAEQCSQKMVQRYPKLIISGTQHGYFSDHETPEVLGAINASGADILIVAFGAPLQEVWMDQHRDSLQVSVCIGVGGCFDFYSGRIPRAPLWVRQLAMEWVWRLAQEPKRMWRRYIVGNPLFLYRAWQQARA